MKMMPMPMMISADEFVSNTRLRIPSTFPIFSSLHSFNIQLISIHLIIKIFSFCQNDPWNFIIKMNKREERDRSQWYKDERNIFPADQRNFMINLEVMTCIKMI
jgi:hypothetical protein